MSRIFAFLVLGSIVVITLAPAAHLQKAPPAQVIVIKAGHLIDVKPGVVRDNQIILIEGERIKSVGARLSIPEGAQVIDLSRSTVLPELIDCHTHLPDLGRAGSESDAMLLNIGNRSTAERALLGVAIGREDLESGITTVRDLGNSGLNGDVALRNAIRSGWVTESWRLPERSVPPADSSRICHLPLPKLSNKGTFPSPARTKLVAQSGKPFFGSGFD